MILKRLIYATLIITAFILLNIIGLFFNDDVCEDVDGRIYGFEKEELEKEWEEDINKFNMEKIR